MWSFVTFFINKQNIAKVHPCHSTSQWCIPFYCCIYCMYLLNFVYPFIVWWTFGLFPFLCIYEWCFYKHLYTSFVWIYNFVSIAISLGMKLLDHIAIVINNLRNCQMFSQSGWTILQSHQQCMKFLVFSHLHQQL